MEGYRSYSEPHSSYPEGRQPYPESQATEPDYAETTGWYTQREPERYDDRAHGGERFDDRSHGGERYDERAHREPERYEDRGPERYDEPRRDHPRPGPSDGTRMVGGRPSPVPGVGPVSGPPPVGPPDLPPPPPPPPPRPAPPRPVAAPGSPGPVGDSLYRSKRPAVAALFWVPALLLEIPALLLLFDGLFGTDLASPSAVAAAVCLLLALPLLAAGLYAVATGAVRAAGPNSIQAWLRPPVAYLTVGILLLLAAGLAA